MYGSIFAAFLPASLPGWIAVATLRMSLKPEAGAEEALLDQVVDVAGTRLAAPGVPSLFRGLVQRGDGATPASRGRAVSALICLAAGSVFASAAPRVRESNAQNSLPCIVTSTYTACVRLARVGGFGFAHAAAKFLR